MRRAAWLSALSFIAIWGTAPNAGAGTTTQSYLQALGLSEIQAPVLRIDANAGSSAHRTPTPFSPPSGATLVSAAYDPDDGLPVLTVEEGQQTYRIHFSKSGASAVAASKLLQLVGANAPHIALVSNFKISTQRYTASALAKFWADAPSSLSWSGVFGSSGDLAGTDELTIGSAMIEEAPAAGTPPFWAGDYETLFALAWIADTDGKSDLRHLLGSSQVYSSVNLFTNFMFAGKSRPTRAALAFGATDPNYRMALEQIGRGEAELMAQKIARVSPAAIQSVFLSSGYPQGLAKLYTAKLIARLNEAIRTLDLRDPLNRPIVAQSFSDPYSVQDSPYIVDGELMQNYPGFSADLTQSVMDNLFRRAAPMVLSALDKSALFMLQSAATATSYNFKGPDNREINAGGRFSISRTITPNPSPKGAYDQYILKDELDIFVSLGTAIRSLTKGPVSVSVSPAWQRRYVFQHPVASQSAGVKESWKLPVNLILRTNFRNLKSGDMLYVQDAISIQAGAGAQLDASEVDLKDVPIAVSGYAQAQATYLIGHQLRYTEDGLPVVVVDSGERVALAASLYIQHSGQGFVMKLLSYPGANLGWNMGIHHVVAYQLPASTAAKMTSVDKLHLNTDVRAALAQHEYKLLQPKFDKLSYDTNYQSLAAGLNLVVFSAQENDLSGSDQFVKNSADPRFYYVVNSSRSNAIRSNQRSCSSQGALEYANSAQKTLKDGVISLQCSKSTGNLTRADAQEMIESLGEAFQLPSRAIENLRAQLPAGSKQLSANVKVFLTMPQILGAMRADTPPPNIVVTADAYNPAIDSYYAPTDEDKFADVVQKMAEKGFKNSKRDALLRANGVTYVEIQIDVDGRTYKASAGTIPSSPVYQYLQDRNAITGVVFGN